MYEHLIPSRELTYPTFGKGKSSTQMCLGKGYGTVPRRVTKTQHLKFKGCSPYRLNLNHLVELTSINPNNSNYPAPTKINVEPENDDLVQMIFLFQWCILRFHLNLPPQPSTTQVWQWSDHKFSQISPGPLHHLVLKELCLITKVSCLIPDHNHLMWWDQWVISGIRDLWVISGIRDQWWSVGSRINGDQWDHVLIHYLHVLIHYLGGFRKWWVSPTTHGFSY